MVSPADPPAILETTLARDPMPAGLATVLGTRFAVPAHPGRPATKAPPTNGDLTGAQADDGKSLLDYLTTLVDRRAPGIQGAVFMGITRDATCVLVHSLFCVYEDAYADAVLWAILGPIPADGTPAYVRVTPLHLAYCQHFVGVDRIDFESSVSGLDPTDGGTPESYAQPVADLTQDTGSRRLSARGLCLVPPNFVPLILDLGPTPRIVKILRSAFGAFTC